MSSKRRRKEGRIVSIPPPSGRLLPARERLLESDDAGRSLRSTIPAKKQRVPGQGRRRPERTGR
jgi:hypothetical protein